MERIIAIAKGEVQRVNYRDEVQRIARKLKVTGYVENLKPYDVRIVAEGTKESLKQFIELIRIQRFPIFVEELEVSWENATGEFEYFEIKLGDWREELFERLDTAGRLLYRSVELGEISVELSRKAVELGERTVELSERSVELGERTVELSERSVELSRKAVELGERTVELSERSVELGEKTASLGEKSVKIGEEMLRAIREESEKTRVVLGGKIDSAKNEIAEKIDLLRLDLREYIEKRFREVQEKILEIEKILKKAGIM